MDDVNERIPIANPAVVLREEFDDWAIVFDPDTGQAFGLNPIGVMVWKSLDGKGSVAAIARRIREEAEGVPEDVEEHIRTFMEAAVRLGLAGYEVS
ncbi:MAG TPA: SynChlorMet cassette protein ScmD [Syntrophales bacterium]|nr:SynChlorMet cassette protein ScmD [Syntrophales bacterium]HOM07500.1 SynChlorMet cassette protein ScmD [Syntrophales bacterium]HOO00035.1 SynChlorMet cassette protein ScmD [Syntrophales bacterium]HPC00851.1 SynChlorMet cassette protein ScmD [Syntrophales bacterium]HPQ07119.1 SynChlorMet cassette protein ScmD [Syntrophales bacterium]